MCKLAVVLALCLPLVAADISGRWEFAVETDQGTGNPTFVFKQEGEKLTGTYSGLFGKADVAGTVKGDSVEFSFKVTTENQTIILNYKGVIESPTRMKGKVDFSGLASGTWTATRK